MTDPRELQDDGDDVSALLDVLYEGPHPDASEFLADLRKQIVERVSGPAMGSGQPASLNDRVIGVDLGGTKILARGFDAQSGKAYNRVKAVTPSGTGSVIEALVETIRKVDGWQEAAGVGVAVPGAVDADGMVHSLPNLAGWDSAVPLAQNLTDQLGMPVAVANDAQCGALAEHRFGAGKGASQVLYIFVGTGVGGALFVNDRLVVGNQGLAGDIGHMTVTPGGRLCGCGGRGHLEAYAGGAGIDREVRERADDNPELLLELAGGGAIKSRHLARGLEEGDPTSVELIAQAAEALAGAIGNATALLDLERVVIGGGVPDKLGLDFLDQISASLDSTVPGIERLKILPSERIDDAGAVGAALYFEMISGFRSHPPR